MAPSKTANPAATSADRARNLQCLAACSSEITKPISEAQGAKIVIDRGRIRDGFRRGELTSEYFLELTSDGAARVVWRGFSHAAALQAAAQWSRAGAMLEDRCATAGGLDDIVPF
jgi:hypothetical protein